MEWVQKEIRLSRRKRGFHLVTDELETSLPEIAGFEIGIAHFFLCHTSASLSINENADMDVRGDLERHIDGLVPEDAPHYRHVAEGPDDMPAHIKNALLGSEVTVPITGGRLNLGTWQGLFLGEHRNNGGSRRVVATLRGKRYPGKR